MHSQIITGIEKVKKFLKDDLEKTRLLLKRKRTPEERRRSKARVRWWVTFASFAFVLLDVVFVLGIIRLTVVNHIAWRTFAPLKSAAVIVVGIAVDSLILGWFAASCWRAWQEIRLEEQARQATPDVGVWPPLPRRD